jgi:tetratricopeptide (TPR) repeat protein
MTSRDTELSTKPKLLYFRPKYGPQVPAFLVQHRDEHAHCLSLFFELEIIEDDCDYKQVCDKHEPDACLFVIGFQLFDARMPQVTNIDGGHDLPRLAVLNADVWSFTRSRILAEVQAIGFDAVFAICTTAGEHFPQFKDRLYYWPNFIDERTFRQRQQDKTDIIYITGNMGEEYPWRRKVRDVLLEAFSAKQSHHFGYSGREEDRMPIGANYARLLGSAWLAPTCGTLANDLVRKHLEIPAVGTCLITERTATVELAGFVDMTNAIFADEHDVVDKVTQLMRNPDALFRIIENGHDLVHRKHTLRARTQIYDWILLHRQASFGARIDQPDPFGPLVLQPRRQKESLTLHIEGRGDHLRQLGEIVRHVNADRLDLALSLINEGKRIAPFMPDIDFLEAYCCLQAGRPEKALRILVRIIKFTLDFSETCPPDPMEWAYLIVALLMMGRNQAAFRHARQFLEVSHPELDKARAAVFLLQNSAPLTVDSKKFLSIHRLQDKPLSSWMNSLASLLDYSGRPSAAQRLRSFPWRSVGAEAPVWEFIRQSGYAPRSAVPMASGRLQRFDNPIFVSTTIRRIARQMLHRLSKMRTFAFGKD